MPGFDSLPTRTTGSLGPTKVTKSPPTDNVGSISAIDWNAAMDALMTLATRLGLADGSTAESIERALRRGAPVDGRFSFFDDFNALRSGASAEEPWAEYTGGTGSVDGVIDADTAPADEFGFGVLKLSAPATSDYAGIVHRGDPLRPSVHDPEFVARVRMPDTFGDCKVEIGFADQANTSYLRLATTAAGAWEVQARSEVNATADTVGLDGDAPVAGSWVEVRITLIDGAVAIYVDGEARALSAALDANSIPQGVDVLSWQCTASEVSSPGGSIYVDWMGVSGVRP